MHQQLLSPADEKAIVRWIVRMEEFGFPPRVSHVKEAINLLKGGTGEYTDKIGRNYLTWFLDRHLQLVAKLSSTFYKRRIKASQPDTIRKHFSRIQQARLKYNITNSNLYNMDEKGFRQGISDKAKVICVRRERGMTGKMATDGTRELITVVETISGDGVSLPPLVIYKGAGHYMGWYQHLDPMTCQAWKFSYTKSGWNNRELSIEWLKHFDIITRSRLTAAKQYRLLVLDGCEIHIHVEFIEYCLDNSIIIYCLPPHSTHLLQPLNVGLFSPLQKYYGKEVDKLVRYGNVAVNKGNFLPMLVNARNQTYTKENIMGAWRGSGLIPPNSRAVLVKLPTYREKAVPAPAPVPPTPQNTKALLHQARQAKLLLKPGSSLSSDQQEELADLIDSLERFAIGADRDLQLERETNRKWRETQKLAAPIDRRELQAQAISGKVLDAATLKYLYEERKRINAKKAAKGAKSTRGQMARKDIKGKQVQLDVSDNEDTHCSVIDISDYGAELETW